MAPWLRTSALLFLVAAASAEIAIALTTSGGGGTPQAVTTRQTTSQPAPTTTQPATTNARSKPKPVAPPNGRTNWPSSRRGWTVILMSYPESSGQSAAQAIAARAAAAGLPQVGVIRSSDFASLRAGYYAVFSGVYASESQAHVALVSAQSHGYTDAYPRQVSR